MALRLETNVPVEAGLLSLTGENAPSNFGQDQMRFRTTKGDLYVSQAVGNILQEAILKQNVQVGEPVAIAKREAALGNGRKGIRWSLEKVGFGPDELEGQLSASIAQVQARKAPAIAPAPHAPATAPLTAWGEALVSQANQLIDAYAQVLKHSARYEGLVKGEDVRSIFLSMFINVTKGGSNGRAA